MKSLIQIIAFLAFFSCNSSNLKEEPGSNVSDIQATSSVMLYLKSVPPIELNQCSTQFYNDTLSIKLTDQSSFYELEILKTKNIILNRLTQLFAVTDSSFRETIFTPLEQQIKFDKPDYKKGDALRGKVNLKFSAFHSWRTIYTDTIDVQGLIYSLIN